MARLARFRRMCDADELPDRHAEPDDRDHQSSQADPVPDPHRHRLLSPDHREGKGNGCLVPLRHHFLCRTYSSCQGGALTVGHRNLPSARRTTQVTRCSPVRFGGSHPGSMQHTVQRGSTATSPHSRKLARPPAHRTRWADIQPASTACSSGRRGRDPGTRKHGMRSACDSERPTTVTNGQSWSLDGCRHQNAMSAFALVRALETGPKLVVRGRVELPTFRFSGWQTVRSKTTRSIRRGPRPHARYTPLMHHDPENRRNDLVYDRVWHAKSARSPT
jgi:hypothetical protein